MGINIYTGQNYHFDPTELTAELEKIRQSLHHEIIASRILIMATLTDLKSSLATLTTSVDALIAKPAGGAASEAELETVKDQVDQLNATVQAALNPATPVLTDPVTDPAAPAV